MEFRRVLFRSLLATQAAPELSDQLDPVYPAIEGIGASALARWIGAALRLLPPAEKLDLLPAEVLARLRLPSLRDALLLVHRPPPDADPAEFAQGIHPAQRRLAHGKGGV